MSVRIPSSGCHGECLCYRPGEGFCGQERQTMYHGSYSWNEFILNQHWKDRQEDLCVWSKEREPFLVQQDGRASRKLM